MAPLSLALFVLLHLSAFRGAASIAAEDSLCLESQEGGALLHDIMLEEDNEGIQLLQVKARGQTSSMQVSVEWDATKMSLRELRQAAHTHASAAVENATSSGVELAPMLEMLEDLYNNSKKQISALGMREKRSKDDFKEREANHNDRISLIEARFQNHSLSEEGQARELQDESRMWAYWQKVRENAHKSYLSSLSIKHSMMHKMKIMIDLYKKVIDGSAEYTEIQEEIAKVTGNSSTSTVVLLQDMDSLQHRKILLKAITQFCDDVLAEMSVASSTL